MKQIKPFPKPSKMKKKHSKKCLSFCSSTFFPSAWNSHCFCDGRLKHRWIKTTKAYNLFLSPASDFPPPPCGWVRVWGHVLYSPRCSSHAPSPAWGSSDSKRWGHWSLSCSRDLWPLGPQCGSHLSKGNKHTHTEFISPLTFLGKAKLHSWQYFSQCSWTILIFMTL